MAKRSATDTFDHSKNALLARETTSGASRASSRGNSAIISSVAGLMSLSIIQSTNLKRLLSPHNDIFAQTAAIHVINSLINKIAAEHSFKKSSYLPHGPKIFQSHRFAIISG